MSETMKVALIKPISPSDVAEKKLTTIPEEIFEEFNTEISNSYSNGTALVTQSSIVDRLVKRGFSRSEIFACGWLNVEEAYRATGWTVKYIKPDYTESFDPYFNFENRSDRELNRK